jgi:hypothetical protein
MSYICVRVLICITGLSKYNTIADILQFHDLKDKYPNMYTIVCVITCIPVSSVDCERGFSKMSLIKSDIRNQMNSETMNALMNISIAGPEPSNVAWGGISELFKNRLANRSNSVLELRKDKLKRDREVKQESDMDLSTDSKSIITNESDIPQPKRHKQSDRISIDSNVPSVFSIVNNINPQAQCTININQTATAAQSTQTQQSEIEDKFIQRIITEHNLKPGSIINKDIRNAIINASLINDPPIKTNENELIQKIRARLL